MDEQTEQLERRFQTDLREAVDNCIDQGYDVEEREPELKLKRGRLVATFRGGVVSTYLE